MWENAAPLPENEPPRPPARCAGSEEDLVLWAQILLCLAAIGLVLAAGALDWPVYPELRRAFTAAMQPEQSLLLGEERNLLKFTEQTAGELADSARSMWEDFTLPAGVYDALRVELGAHAGRNWFCVLYPGLCLPAAGEAAVYPTEAQQDLVEAPRVEVRFAALEWLEHLTGEAEN